MKICKHQQTWHFKDFLWKGYGLKMVQLLGEIITKHDNTQRTMTVRGCNFCPFHTEK